MVVRFGNLSVLRFEELTEVAFNDEDFIWLNEHQSDKVDTGDDKFHIFDLPLGMTAGCNIYDELVERLKGYKFQRHFYVEKQESDIKPDSE